MPAFVLAVGLGGPSGHVRRRGLAVLACRGRNRRRPRRRSTICRPTSSGPTEPMTMPSRRTIIMPVRGWPGLPLALHGTGSERGAKFDQDNAGAGRTIPYPLRRGRQRLSAIPTSGACTASVPAAIHQMLSHDRLAARAARASRPSRRDGQIDTRTATLLNPTNAELHARLADASARDQHVSGCRR